MLDTIKPTFTFYRAMRMHSADYAVTRRLSLRLSVIRRYCVETEKYIIELISLSGSNTETLIPILKRGPPVPTVGIKSRLGIKYSRFSTNILLYLGNDTR